MFIKITSSNPQEMEVKGTRGRGRNLEKGYRMLSAFWGGLGPLLGEIYKTGSFL
jgi:hypothetical protein